MEVVRTQKGNAAIHLNGYKYVKHRTNSNASTVWRCARYWSHACKATLVTEGSELIAENGVHVHEPNAKQVHVDRARAKLRMKWLHQRPANKSSTDRQGKSSSERRELQKKGGGVSSWKHFKRMEALLGSRGSMRDLEDSQDAVGDEGAEDDGMELAHMLIPEVSTYVENQSEFIVPTTTDSNAASTSNTPADAPSSLLLCDVRSLAAGPPTSEAASLPPIRIKEERVEESMEEESFQQHVPAPSPPAATTFSAPLQASTMTATPTVTSVLRAIGPAVVLPSVVDNPTLCTPSQPHSATAVPHHDTEQPGPQETNPSGTSTSAGAFVRGRKRSATPWNVPSINERKARIELEILLAQRRKLESEMRKSEADERKVVAETLLMAEEVKKCEEEKKKLKAEAEFFVQEKKRSEEETRKAAAIADYHLEEKRKAAAKTDMLIEHKMLYIEQQKTEIVRRRMLLLEMKKMKQDLKLVQ